MSNGQSPAPGTPQTNHKAVWTAASTFALAFLAFWVGDADPFTLKDAGEAVLFAAGSSGVAGYGTYKVRNRVR